MQIFILLILGQFQGELWAFHLLGSLLEVPSGLLVGAHRYLYPHAHIMDSMGRKRNRVYLYRHAHCDPLELNGAEALVGRVQNIVVEYGYLEEREKRESLLNRVSDPKDPLTAADLGYKDDYHLKRTMLYEKSGRRIVLEHSPYPLKCARLLREAERCASNAFRRLDLRAYELNALSLVRKVYVPLLKRRDPRLFTLIDALEGDTLVLVGTNHVYLRHLLDKGPMTCVDRYPPPLTAYEKALIRLCTDQGVGDCELFTAYAMNDISGKVVSALRCRGAELKLGKALDLPKGHAQAYACIQKFFEDARRAKAADSSLFTRRGRTFHDFLVEWVDKNIGRL